MSDWQQIQAHERNGKQWLEAMKEPGCTPALAPEQYAAIGKLLPTDSAAALPVPQTFEEWEQLRRMAEAATPGPWAVDHGEKWTAEYPRETYVRSEWTEPIKGSLGFQLCAMSGVHNNTAPDSAFIAAANPAAVLKLLDQLAALSSRPALHAETREQAALLKAAKALVKGTTRPDGSRLLLTKDVDALEDAIEALGGTQ